MQANKNKERWLDPHPKDQMDNIFENKTDEETKVPNCDINGN
jgi:hypothetical protein